MPGLSRPTPEVSTERHQKHAVPMPSMLSVPQKPVQSRGKPLMISLIRPSLGLGYLSPVQAGSALFLPQDSRSSSSDSEVRSFVSQLRWDRYPPLKSWCPGVLQQSQEWAHLKGQCPMQEWAPTTSVALLDPVGVPPHARTFPHLPLLAFLRAH